MVTGFVVLMVTTDMGLRVEGESDDFSTIFLKHREPQNCILNH